MYNPLSEKAIRDIHEGSLEILGEVGIEIDNQRALEILSLHGAKVLEGNHLTIPRSLVEKALNQVPSEFTLYGRREENHIHYRHGCFYTSTGGSAMYVLDLDTGERRHSTCKDLHDIVSLVDELPHIDLISLPVYLNDLPREYVDVNRFFAGLRNSTKHVIGAVYTVDGLAKISKMAEIIGGENWKARPIISVVLCPLISPLRLDRDATEILVRAAEKEIITHNFSMTQVGCTAPMTLAGTLVLLNAEVLAVTTLIQLIQPGLPTLYCSVPGLTDMMTGRFITGGIEYALLNAGASQMAQFYKMPNWATAGRTDSKVPDAQAAYEHALTIPYVALSGVTHVSCGAGFLDFVLTVSFEQYVIDNEIIGMVKRMRRGFEVNQETMALDLIERIGPGGNFVTEEHTVRHMREELFQPILSDRQEREQWLEAGGKDARERARDLAKNYIDNHMARGLTPDQERNVLNSIEGIVKDPK
ncbi:MAG: trimethylamine methyltransferase [Proteobacteria bacterium]|nr:trimethylamine methyltransferase [Pseudomonadota bacterium]